MSRKQNANSRFKRKHAHVCKKCGHPDVQVKSYADGWDLHICRACRFPRRVKR